MCVLIVSPAHICVGKYITKGDNTMGTRELTVYELAQRWDYLRNQCGVNKLVINEDFPVHGKYTYIVEGLSMEFEKDFALCGDYSGNIIKLDSPLIAFLKEHLLKIQLIPITNGYQERLEFYGNGIVLIEKAS